MDDNQRNYAAAKFLTDLGLPVDDKMVEQAMIFARCLELYHDRDSRYTGLWKVRGWLGSLFQMDHKMARLMRIFWENEATDEDPDDAYDLINYSAFFLRNHAAGNRNGAEASSTL